MPELAALELTPGDSGSGLVSAHRDRGGRRREEDQEEDGGGGGGGRGRMEATSSTSSSSTNSLASAHDTATATATATGGSMIEREEEAETPLPPLVHAATAPAAPAFAGARHVALNILERTRTPSARSYLGGGGFGGGSGGKASLTPRALAAALTPRALASRARVFFSGHGHGHHHDEEEGKATEGGHRRHRKKRPVDLKDIHTDGDHFDDIPTPVAFSSQRTKLVSENTSYYRWAEEDSRYLEPARLVGTWTRENLAMILSSFAVATTSSFFAVPISFYVIEQLGLDAAATNVAQQMVQLPQAFQVPIGLLTDCVPIRKRRRKYYILAGWLMYIAAMTSFAMIGKPGINALVGLLFLSFFGAMLMDLAQRALVVQRSRYESDDHKGYLMVNYNLAWQWGTMIGNIMGTFLYESNFPKGGGMSLGQIALFAAVVNVALLPSLYWLFDPKVCSVTKTRPIKEELADVWSMVQRKSVLLPMLFVGIFNVVWVPNSSWDLFLIRGLQFTEQQIGLLGLLGAILGALGAAVYRFCLMQVNWRKIFVFTSIVMALTNCLQILLVFGVNKKWGISDFFFACGDSMVDSLVDGFHIMPISIMYLGLCPGGAEGTALAALQTFVSLAVMMSNNVGLLFLNIWDVSVDAIANGRYAGIWKVTLLTALLQMAGILFVKLMPRNAKHQEEIQSFDRNILWGGVAFVLFVVVAFCVTIGLDVSYIVQGFG